MSLSKQQRRTDSFWVIQGKSITHLMTPWDHLLEEPPVMHWVSAVLCPFLLLAALLSHLPELRGWFSTELKQNRQAASENCVAAILLWKLQGEFFVSSTSKSYLCLISLLNCFIFSPGGNLNNNGEKSFLLHLKLEEDYRKFSDKSPNSKNSVAQIAVARKIFTKMVATWVSSCWPDRESTSTVLVGFPRLFWCFLQFSMLAMPLCEEDTMNFLKTLFWLISISLSSENFLGKMSSKTTSKSPSQLCFSSFYHCKLTVVAMGNNT